MAIISFGDIIDVYCFIRRTSLAQLWKRFNIVSSKSATAAWEENEYAPRFWGNIACIQRHLNELVSGNEEITGFSYVAEQYLRALEPLTGLSLCCGRGTLECELYQTARFRSLIGIDVAPALINQANELARTTGCVNLKFECADINYRCLPDRAYHVIYCNAALHHLRNVNDICLTLRNALKPGGYLVINEYVGPNRLQFTNVQLAETNLLLAALPAHYRKRYGLRMVKNKAYTPGLVRMLFSDASEAVESSRILPAISNLFDTVLLVNLGGTILQPLFHDIAQNFRDESCDNAVVHSIIADEAGLMAKNIVASDFVFGVFQKSAKA